MRRTFLIILLCFFSAACGQKEIYRTSDKITVGVLDFQQNSDVEELESYRKGLTDMFISELQSVEQLQIVERSRLESVMKEMKLSEFGAIDSETAQQIGRLIGAQAVYYGSFTYIPAFGKTIRLDGRLVRVETGEIMAAGNHESEIESKKLYKMVGKVSKIIARKVKSEHGKLVADSFYSKGRTAEEKSDKDTAIRHYRRALQHYSDHELSQKALKRLNAFALDQT